MNDNIKAIIFSMVFFLGLSGLIYGAFIFTNYTGFAVKEVVTIPYETRFEGGLVKVSLNENIWSFGVDEVLEGENIVVDITNLELSESGELYIDILVNESVVESKKVIIEQASEEEVEPEVNITEEISETVEEPVNETNEDSGDVIEEIVNETEESNETVEEIIEEDEIPVEELINESQYNETEENQSKEDTIPLPENITTNETVPTENVSVVQEIEEVIQPLIVINQPVRWVKKVKLEDYSDTLSVDLPKEASNISVKKVDGGKEEAVEETKVKVREEGVVKELEEVNLITGGIVFETKDSRRLKQFFGSVADFFTSFFKKPTITGLAIGEEENTKEVIIDGPVKEVEVEYEVPGPGVTETETESGKRVTIFSEAHYENILAYTSIPETDPEGISLYWNQNTTRTLVENVDYLDENLNGLIDKIQWVVPHLSNQTYEVDLIILNVQSYPYVGGNWTVRFNTTGTANLTISSFNGTSFEDYVNDSKVHDLEFLELRCGSELISNNLSSNDSLFVPDYGCIETNFETSKVLTTGDHYLKFEFGPITRYAKNLAAEYGGLAGGGNASGTINLVTGAVAFTGSNETTGSYTTMLHGLVSVGKNITSGLYTLGLGYIYMLDIVQNVFVSLVSPADTETITTAVFTYRPSASEIDSCSLYGNWPGAWHVNQTDYSISLGSTNQFTLAELEEGTFEWNVMCNNSQGDFFAENNYTFTLNKVPSVPELNEPLNNSIWNSSIPYFNWSNSTDAGGDEIFYYLEIDDSIAFDSIDYANSSIKETENTTSDLPTDLSAGSYWWRVLAYDGNANSSWSEVRNVSIRFNEAPTAPDLFLPYNETLVTDRQPVFSWSNSSDPDNDALSYNIQVDGSIDFSSPEVDGFDVTSIAETANTTNWTATSDLQNLDAEYFWRVRAFDGIAYSNWSEVRNFTVTSAVIIELVTDSINFTVANPGDSDDTTDDSPSPIIIRNSGNIGADVNISLASGSTGIWASKVSPTEYFQYKIDNKTDEEGSFNWTDSITGWTDVDVANSSYKIRNLNYSDTSDEAELDIKITVPLDEPSGEKTASVIITGAITSEIP